MVEAGVGGARHWKCRALRTQMALQFFTTFPSLSRCCAASAWSGGPFMFKPREPLSAGFCARRGWKNVDEGHSLSISLLLCRFGIKGFYVHQ